MNPRPDNALEPGALHAALGSLSLSDGNTVATSAFASASASTLQPSPPTLCDQVLELREITQDVAMDEVRLMPDDDPMMFSICPKSWWEMIQDGKLEQCIARQLFRVSYDSSRRLVTIMPPLSARHQSFVFLLMELAYKTELSIPPALACSMRMDTGSAVWTVTEGNESSLKVPDLLIRWAKNINDVRAHTIVEMSESLEDHQYLAPFYLNGNADIQRVILINMVETPRFEPPESVDIYQEFRRDEKTGVIWFGNVKVVGETKMSWEVWERDIAGVPQPTFQEAFAFGETPSRNLPFLTIREGVYGDAATMALGGVDSSVTPQMIKNFWTEHWPCSSWTDARSRMLPLLGDYRLERVEKNFLPTLKTSPSGLEPSVFHHTSEWRTW
ncbi:hypothetical protein AYL99_11608 [Fonsecaea erecta]|uniref:Uncharacterized protein n=1 Tax=Fonsecaea erecta TaxID=1367422 RepID=A0A178Z2Z5_9EURO|nr:hypothetical protein AYL99_11608 [Fonsecaea erecta]OAP54074.1 hypothetical protein AYL99_11608 [Fonsecaea erecta]